MQSVIVRNERDVYFGKYKTLIEIERSFGKNTSVAWLIPQLYNLSEYCGCKNKMSTEMMKECAEAISITYGFLKISEIMYFFFLFKSGKFGKFYGNVDPITITCALNEFLQKRIIDIDFYEKELQRNRLKLEMANSMTYDEYLKLK